MDEPFSTIDAVVETPKGSRNKYEFDPNTGAIRLDRVLFSSIHYPGDYGFIPGTVSGDGDPLDVLILVEEPTFPGCRLAGGGRELLRDVQGAGGEDHRDRRLARLAGGHPRSGAA